MLRTLVGRPTALALMVAAALAGGVHGSAQAAGLGRLTVQSALGQPLDARVEITSATASELDSLSARLAPVEAFRQAGIEPNPALSSFRFTIERRPDGRAFVRIASELPITEPFVDLLVELNWAAGRFIREYTFLLDPPDSRFAHEAVRNGQTLPGEVPGATPPGDATAGALHGQRPSTPPESAHSRLPQGIRAPVPSGVLSVQPPVPPAALPLPAMQPGSAAPAFLEGAAPAAMSTPGQDWDGSLDAPVVAQQRLDGSAGTLAGQQTAGSTAPAAAVLPGADQAAPGADQAVPGAAQTVPGVVTVGRGESLASIAKRVKPPDVSVEQAVIALYEANPDAFFGSVHQLHAGRTLEIPGRAAMASRSPAEARRMILSQAEDYETYRQRLAEAARKTELAESGASANAALPGPAAGDGVSTGTEDAAQANLPEARARESLATAEQASVSPPGDRLRLSASTPEQAAELARLAENEGAYAGNAVLREQQERLALLEESVASLQRLVEQKNEQLAKLERLVEASGLSVADVADSTGTGALVFGTNGTEIGAALAAARSAGIGLGGNALAAGLPSVHAAAAGAATQSSAEATPAGPRSLVDTLFGHPLVIPGLALALGAFVWYSLRRRRPAEAQEDELVYPPALDTRSLYEPPTDESVGPSRQGTPDDASKRDAGLAGAAGAIGGVGAGGGAGGAGGAAAAGVANRDARLVQASLASDELADQPDELVLADHVPAEVRVSEVDPLGEAEVYLAYGREAQAEEVLREALEREPERHDVRFVLLEIYAEREDRTAFALLAREMYALTGGKNEEWWQVAAMGRVLEPDNRLYAPEGAAAASEVDDSAVRSGDTRTALERAIDGRFDLPSLDLDIDPVEDERSASPTLTNASDFQLDLPSLDEIDPGKTVAKPAPDSVAARRSVRQELDEAAIGIASLDFVPAQDHPPKWQETDAKLDLAEAYRASGDKTGARELLAEVARDGDDEQKRRAQALLSTLR